MRGKLLITAAALLGAASCASSGSQSGGGSTVDVELYALDAEVVEQRLDRVVLSFPWELENPRIKAATVGAVSWTLEIEDEPPATGKQVFDQEAGPGGRTAGALRVEAPTETTQAAFDRRIGKAALRYSMKATFEIATEGKVEQYVAEWNHEIFPPKKPEITVKAEAGRFGGKSLEFTFLVGISNPNPFEITVGAFDYVLYIKDTPVSKASLAQGQRIVPASELQFDVQRFVGKDDLHELAAEIINLDAIPYRLDGKLIVNDISIEAPLTGEIHFAK